MPREPEVNSLDRYVKSSPRFVLEEHSHCEVPAGCGGVVLRWRDRFTSIPVEIHVAVVGAQSWQVRVDGTRPKSARPLLPPGRHVLVLAAEGLTEEEFAVFLWATTPGVEGPLMWTPGSAQGWRASVAEPDPVAWTDPDFDVSSWSEPVPAEVAEDPKAYTVHRLRRLGAEPVTVRPFAPRLWLRAVFEIPEP